MKMTPIRQKQPSIWMAIAILQAYTWLFILPKTMKPLWSKIFEGKSSLQCELILSTIVPLSLLVYTLCMLPIYYLNIPFFEQYKISDKPWPWQSDNQQVRKDFWDLSLRSIKLNAFNMLILIPSLVFIKHLSTFGLSSYDVEDWPSHIEIARDIIAMTFLHEFSFYSTHRLMHTYPFLYKFHKIHHEYKMNTVLASQHNHPIDYIISIAGPALIVGIVCQPHSITLFQFTLYILFANYDDHVGYSFPWSPVRWIPLANLTEQHEFHHAVNLGCFASKLNIYDKVFHSDNVYLKWSKKRSMTSVKTE